ncbi:hypothetical protein FN846DRAFT_896360 [Sphaerosporella brunnea]|uniref:Uncharacterized protein n=1 Tax=Sphaerosporella brunnea TaxID=1250544 RepID=A0A5J5EE35_9PEZI|nr:hypothetical protein FN846DRAFT_896360 [Sphaerosporella brunnea]
MPPARRRRSLTAQRGRGCCRGCGARAAHALPPGWSARRQTPGQGQATDHQDDEEDQSRHDEETEDSGFMSPLERLEQRLEQQRPLASITITRGNLDRIADQMVAWLQRVPAASQGVAPAQPSMFPPFQAQTDSEDVEVPA